MSARENDDELFPLIAAERRSTADILDGLTPEQWATPSLCGAWTVREVAAHLTVGWNVSLPRFAWGMIRHRGFDGFNVVAAKQLAERPTDEIVADMRSNAENRWTPPGVGAIAPLSDAIIHAADIRRPLGIASATPVASLRPVLDSLAEGGKRNPLPLKDASGLHFNATDQDWSAGDGAVVEGPSESLALAMAGRSGALDELSGDGLAEFRTRVS